MADEYFNVNVIELKIAGTLLDFYRVIFHLQRRMNLSKKMEQIQIFILFNKFRDRQGFSTSAALLGFRVPSSLRRLENECKNNLILLMAKKGLEQKRLENAVQIFLASKNAAGGHIRHLSFMNSMCVLASLGGSLTHRSPPSPSTFPTLV